MIVDTMSAWDRELLISALASEDLRPEDITHVVNTHGHPDHVGNNNLFTGPGVVHVMGHSIHISDIYNTEINFKAGATYSIDGDNLQVMYRISSCQKLKTTRKVFATPGHTMDSVSVKVFTREGVCVVSGDTFEKEEDLTDDSIWKEAGSDSEELQRKSREEILSMADIIVPGHGPSFKNPSKHN